MPRTTTLPVRIAFGRRGASGHAASQSSQVQAAGNADDNCEHNADGEAIVAVVVARAFTGNAAPVNPRSRDHHTQVGEELRTLDRLEVSKVSLCPFGESRTVAPVGQKRDH